MASIVYNRGVQIVASGEADLEGDTIKVMLLANTYTPDKADNVLADVSAHEISGSGYTAGGATLANKSVTEDDGNDRVAFDADDVVWSNATITARYAVVYDDTLADDPLLFCYDFEEDKSSSGANFTFAFNAAGACLFAQAA